MQKHVIILGGGVAGMSAAHELAERNFKVTVFERHKTLVGGKARSIPVPESASGGRLPLPGEHGFRFFPGFYKNIIDTMKRIPFQDPITKKWNKNGVSDNLVACPSIMIARTGQEPIFTPAHFPRSPEEIEILLHNLFNIETGLKPGESKIIALKIWQLMTSCKERFEKDYEETDWWTYTDADCHSESYKTLFVAGLTRTLVAARADKANARTNGKILLQMLFNFSNSSVPADRILRGPTNEMWLHPWLTYLRDKGVDYQHNNEVVEVQCDDKEITGVLVSENKGPAKRYHADYYLCALPVERAAKLITPQLIKLDPSLQNIKKLSSHVAWMNGIQFYLKKDISINKGHIILIDSAWALTAISQIQFWKNFDLTRYGDGGAHGIISVDVCNWEKEGILCGKAAMNCTEEEVIAEVWEQMKRSFNINGNIILDDDNFHAVYIDEDIVFGKEVLKYNQPSSVHAELKQPAKYGSNKVNSNEEPLLINEKNSWKIRNQAKTGIHNLFLAADYIRNFTNLATMEGANEAAKFAVNHILDASGSDKPRCAISDLREPGWLNIFKRKDKQRFDRGEKWKPFPWYLHLASKLTSSWLTD
jgi:uncharacterized protein with NAD-binding domain and iron-sulfur cluster